MSAYLVDMFTYMTKLSGYMYDSILPLSEMFIFTIAVSEMLTCLPQLSTSVIEIYAHLYTTKVYICHR